MCPLLFDPVNGNVVVDGYGLDNTALYSCVDGYKLEGPESRVCEEIGMWSGIDPSCKGNSLPIHP